ncbi:probable ATP-dependent DNA helicase RecS [Mytilus trossulus]|uniref:probable ATP-dependent DNA helicase RecS n=1 Tax=Mytilus trossulus TaxID=6551 RepID=UPI0030078AB2
MFGSAYKMATSSDSSEINEAIIKILPQFGVKELKAEQMKILKCMISRDDCLAVLPTGFGKSLPFQMCIPVQRELHINDIGKIIVCCPLVSIMKDQVERLQKIPNLKAVYIGSSSDISEDMKDVNIIYASPETLVGDPICREVLKTLHVSTIVIDEFHTIATWGEDIDGKPAFRKWFQHIGEIRSICPTASVLALSATCTLKIRKRVMNALNLSPDVTDITMSPNKENIKIVVNKVNTELEIAMCWLIDGLHKEKENFPKTLIYCTSIIDVSKMYKYMSNELPSYIGYIDMYHSESTTSRKDKILTELKKPDSSLRIIVATSALGMGVDICDCQNIILYGAPKTTLDLIQQMGRAGRNAKPSLGLILYNSYNSRHVDVDVKQVYSSKDCRRTALLQPFLKKSDMDKLRSVETSHTCCDLCALKCSCGICESLPLEIMFTDTSNISESESDSNTESYDWAEYEAELMGLPDLDICDD